MAIDLNMLTSPSANRPVIMTLFGEGGTGKTTLAAQFPYPVFIRTEDGTQSIAAREDVALFPVATRAADVTEAIQALCSEEHDFRTLVIDSVTQLDIMLQHEICEASGVESVNQALGGYGAGFAALSRGHRSIREAAGQAASAMGMHVVFIAHAAQETIDPPDLDSYTRHSLRLPRQCITHYTDNVDAVCHVRLVQRLAGDERKRAVSDDRREIVCHAQLASIAKNRFGITNALPFPPDSFPFSEWVADANNGETS